MLQHCDLMTVNVDIAHSFRGDLQVSLHKGSQAVVLSDRAGGGADNLVLSADVSQFVGQDLAGSDVGTLRSWSLEAVVE